MINFVEAYFLHFFLFVAHEALHRPKAITRIHSYRILHCMLFALPHLT